MTEIIPPAVLAAAAEAVNEAHAKRGWNKPAPWWVKEVSAAVLEAAAPLLAEAWGVSGDTSTVTEWGTRQPSGIVVRLGVGDEDEQVSRAIAADHAAAGNPGALRRRTVTYGPWEAVSSSTAATREDGEP